MIKLRLNGTIKPIEKKKKKMDKEKVECERLNLNLFYRFL